MSVHTDLSIVDNVYVKLMHLQYAGDVVEGHAHTFDHITLLAKGKVNMEARGEVKEHSAPKLIVTPKGIVHKFTAISSDVVLCCVHAIRDGDEMEDIAPPNITEEEAVRLMNQFPLTLDQPR